ncbi:MAG TPA: YnbE family lipoprotein [Rhodospirillaceae bacterium]|nr:YnbE family lipoprotein [Rhodospirillaceae bacterium]
MTVRFRRLLGLSVLMRGTLCGATLALATACQPTVQVAAPEKPIVINLNVKIEHEVRVKLEKDVDDLLKKNSDLF